MGDALLIELPGCAACHLKVDDDGWQLLFVPVASVFPAEAEQLTIIQGSYTARCSMVLADVLIAFRVWQSTQFHLRKLIRGWTIVSPHLDPDRFQLFLSLGGKFMFVSLYGGFETRAVYNYKRLCKVRPSFQPRLLLEVPARRLVRSFGPRIDPSESPDFATFVYQVVLPVMRIAEVFERAPKWTVVPAPAQRMIVSFRLVCIQRFTMFCQVRAAATCLMTVPNGQPSGFLLSCLKDLPDVPLVRRQNNESLYRLNLDRFEHLKQLVETFCDLCCTVANALDVDLGEPGKFSLSSDLAVVTANRRIGGRTLQIVIAKGKIDWQLDGCEGIADLLRTLTSSAESMNVFVPAAVHLVLVFLPIDHRLLSDVLGLLVRFATEKGLVVPAMESALIENSGRPSICFPCQVPFTAEFPSPYNSSGQILIRLGGRVEKIRGIERIRDFWKTS
jgi:hypothetical protein